MRRITEIEARTLVGIGFCQPKFYKRHVWLKAKRLMDTYAVPNSLAYPHDLGRGKGKYSTNHESIEGVKTLVVQLLRDDGLIKELFA